MDIGLKKICAKNLVKEISVEFGRELKSVSAVLVVTSKILNVERRSYTLIEICA